MQLAEAGGAPGPLVWLLDSVLSFSPLPPTHPLDCRPSTHKTEPKGQRERKDLFSSAPLSETTLVVLLEWKMDRDGGVVFTRSLHWG